MESVFYGIETLKINIARAEVVGIDKHIELVSYVQSFVGKGIGAEEELKEIQRRCIEIKKSNNKIGDLKINAILFVGEATLKEYNNFYDLLKSTLIYTDVDNAIGALSAVQALGVDKASNYDTILEAAKEDPKIVIQSQLNAESKKIEKTTKDLSNSIYDDNWWKTLLAFCMLFVAVLKTAARLALQSG